MPQSLNVQRLRASALVPKRATEEASGLDLYAFTDGAKLTITSVPQLVPTGIALEVPAGLDVQVRPRSGLSLRGVMVPVGTIDSDYRGEVFVTMYLVGEREPHVVNDGDRIAQLVVGRLADVDVVEVEEVSETGRGAGGHGSTGA